MKTITEFSGTIIRGASEALRTFRAQKQAAQEAESKDVAAVADESGAVVAAPVESAVDSTPEPGEGASASSEADGVKAARASAEDAAEVAARAATASAPGEGPEAEAVSAAVGVTGERLARLMEALDVVGKRAAEVRLVRVLRGEGAPSGGEKRGEHIFIVDVLPRRMTPRRPERRRDSHGGHHGRGGRRSGEMPDGGGDGRRARPAGGGGPGVGAQRGAADRPRRDRTAENHRSTGVGPGSSPDGKRRRDLAGGGGSARESRRGFRDDREPRVPGGPDNRSGGPGRVPGSKPARPRGGPEIVERKRRPKSAWTGPRRGGWDEPAPVPAQAASGVTPPVSNSALAESNTHASSGSDKAES